jgi:hypothetical protein
MHSDAMTWADGMVSEWCGEFIDADHATMHQLIKRFGLRTIELGGGRTDRTRSVLYFHHRYYRAGVREVAHACVLEDGISSKKPVPGKRCLAGLDPASFPTT